ncbi:MAG: NAD(P)-dependent oxidoreductase [Balneolaceae bacterium]|nr:NAD(P)-dependent oxidoreductase [Balneolaceae bacterium]
MITVFADQHLYKIKEIVPDNIDLHFYDPELGLPAQLNKADALLVRTVTGVNNQTLSPIPQNLSFLATGSAGTDHVDQQYLKQHDIQFAHSAGCNARSVAEYVVTALIIWSGKNKIDLKKECIGIVGVGHVGSALQQMLDTLGWEYRLYDPPRAEREDEFSSVPLKEVLDCSILTFHTPLYNNSEHATYHWLNSDKLSNRNFKMVLNTSRGGVVDEDSLLEAVSVGRVEDMVIDVWRVNPLLTMK